MLQGLVRAFTSPVSKGLGVALLAVTIALGGTTLGWWQSARTAREAASAQAVASQSLQNALRARQADSQALRSLREEIARLRAQNKATEALLEEALARNPEWSEQEIPDEVRDCLNSRPDAGGLCK